MMTGLSRYQLSIIRFEIFTGQLQHMDFWQIVTGRQYSLVPQKPSEKFGYALATEAGIPYNERRNIHAPDGYSQEGNYDVVS